MGLLGNIIEKVGSSKVGKVVFKPGGVVDTITKPAQYLGAIVANPVTTVTKGLGAAMEKAKTESFEKQAGKVILNTGVVAGAVLTGGTSVGRTAATTLGKSLIPTTAKGAVITGATAIVGAGVLSKTDKPIEALAKAPSSLYNFGSNAGSLIEDPSLKNAEKLLKENPLLSAVSLGGAGLLVGKTLLPAVSTITNLQTKEAVQDLITNQNDVLPKEKFALTDVNKEKTIAANPNIPTTPITPQTNNLVSTTTSKPRRKKKGSPRSLPQNISQRVNVIVQNKNSSIGIKQNKKYLNARAYA